MAAAATTRQDPVNKNAADQRSTAPGPWRKTECLTQIAAGKAISIKKLPNAAVAMIRIMELSIPSGVGTCLLSRRAERVAVVSLTVISLNGAPATRSAK